MKLVLLIVAFSVTCATAQTNSFPLFSNGNSAGNGTGDMTNLGSPQLKLQSSSSYPRVIHISGNAAVSAVYNFETGKYAYWGEPSDAGQYIFRGRDFVLGEGKMTVGSYAFSPNARLNVNGGGIDVGTTGSTTDASLHIKTSYGSLDRLTQMHPSVANKPALNLIASTDASMNYNWWSWGVHTSGAWAIQPTTSFTGSSGFFIDRVGNAGIGTSSPEGLQINASLIQESSKGVSNVRLGVLGSPRIILDANGYAPIEMDNYSGSFRIFSPGSVKLQVNSNGYVGIGTATPDQLLTVNGTVHSKEVKVDLSVPGPDYVFEKSYALPSLESIQTYIDQNKHLPEVPSAKEMETNGINLSEMNMLLLKKVEELTLYMLEMDRKISIVQKENAELKKKLK